MERVSGPRGECHRHLFARLSSARARAAQSGSASCWPGGRWPATCHPGSSSRSSSPRSTAPARPGPHPTTLPGDPAPGSLWHRPRIPRPSAACAPRFSLVLFPAAAAASGHTLSHSNMQNHSCDSRGPEEPRGEVTRPGLPPALPLPPPARRVVEFGGLALLLPGNGVGAPTTGWGTARGRPGSGLGAADWGLGTGFPGVPRGEGQSGAVWVPTGPGS